jgi:hypothetical protein
MRRRAFFPASVATLLLTLALAGCNAFGITGDDGDENEVRVTVTALGADYLDANDGFRYLVSADTEYEGLAGFAALAVGAIVEIEFEDAGNDTRRALEIEADGEEDDD